MDRQEKKVRILEAALRIFARYGFKKTTLEDIAGELGMTKGNLYLYVKDKRDLYEKSVAHAFREWQERVAEDVEGKKDVVVRFRVMCVKAYQYLARNGDLQSIVLRDPTIFTLSPKEDRFYSPKPGGRGDDQAGPRAGHTGEAIPAGGHGVHVGVPLFDLRHVHHQDVREVGGEAGGSRLRCVSRLDDQRTPLPGWIVKTDGEPPGQYFGGRFSRKAVIPSRVSPV